MYYIVGYIIAICNILCIIYYTSYITHYKLYILSYVICWYMYKHHISIWIHSMGVIGFIFPTRPILQVRNPEGKAPTNWHWPGLRHTLCFCLYCWELSPLSPASHRTIHNNPHTFADDRGLGSKALGAPPEPMLERMVLLESDELSW